VKVDPDAVTGLLREAAERYVLPRFDALRDDEIEEKAPGDLVTVADREAERFLEVKLPQLLPGSLVVGEEAHAETPDILGRFSDATPVWSVDPVDGTKNFTQARETFCMMVALVIENRAVMAWIHDPLKDRTVTAVSGAGAFDGEERLRVPPPPAEKDMTGLLNALYFDEPRRGHLRSAARSRFGKVSSLSCAGQDFLAQAEGRRHFSFYRRLWPWDHAPGVLILREAGGEAGRIDGTPYRAGDRVHGLLTAPDRHTWEGLRQFLLESDPD
jgi:fructose-1,6-bisphosphatase/inositol monophosphatase family enzyme